MLFKTISKKKKNAFWLKKVSCLSLLLALTMAFALFAGMPSKVLAANVTTLKIQTAWGGNLPILGDTLVVLAETVEKISGGQLKLKIYDPNKLAPTLEIFDAVSSGVIDGGWAFPGYWVGKNSAINLFAATPFGPTADAALAWYYKAGGMELWREIYGKFDVVPLLGGLNSPEAGGWFNKEIKSSADFKGLKVRWAGLGANLVEALGASTALIPAGEVVTSLQKGIIDGAELGNPFLDKLFGMHKGGKYYYFPGWHQTFGAMELLINKTKWEQLTDQERTWLETAASVSTIHSLAIGASLQADAMEFFKQNNVQFRRYPDEVLQTLRDIMPEVMAKESEKNPDFKKVWESIRSFLDKYDVYGDLNNLSK
ncbi:MAG: TRAP transporter substrate-binding protein [Proteobacteria bacterium]|nr:TRAP transporter substrate-binding protein [Pseudomonadota bacterium]MBU1695825.1 TRAP transporter substrate-binding protein [Pseudomonadota bacterium]